MSGLILLATLIALGWAGTRLVRYVGKAVPNPRWKKPAMTATALLLLSAPLVDEVIGMYQFKALCKANGIESADVSGARGKRVQIHDMYFDWKEISGAIRPMKETDTNMKDAETGEVLAQYKNYRAKGGWLMRYTPISMGHAMRTRPWRTKSTSPCKKPKAWGTS